MSIPQIIHYCWFGPEDIPVKQQIYIKNWKKKLPEYKFILWNEGNFDINSVKYVKQAYEQKKFAFVADYVRLYALIYYGGIYMDTDVELLRNFDPFLNDKAFIGFENRTMVGTGIIGTEVANPLLIEMINYYNNHSFIDENGIIDTTTNVKILNSLLVKRGMAALNREQSICGFHIYERNIFCPKMVNKDKFDTNVDSVTIHHFEASWLTEREIKRGRNLFWRNICRPVLRKIRTIIIRVVGDKKTKLIETKIREMIR